MALRRLFTKRLLDGFKTIVSPAAFDRAISPPPHPSTFLPSPPEPAAGNTGFFRRFLLKRAVYHSAPTRFPEFLSIPVGEKLREKLRSINNVTISRDRLRMAPLSPSPESPVTSDSILESGISAEEVRKVLKATMAEKVKAKLSEVPAASISYGEFLRICVEACENRNLGEEFAKILDNAGNVIVFGNVVFLRPEQVAKAMESLIYQSIAKPNDPRRKELDEMEKKKALIDEKAKAQVKTELYFGLGFLTLQTLGFMRLTFWELTWDVMEPICFFVTSIHFALAYIFFIRTSTEPTFQGYFHRRFKVKQERLMKANNFDINKYNELCKACYQNPSVHADGALSGAIHR
ncbi:calcium uniporter protein 4, mitochondrial [Arachis ipaensis]|uniref:calcium uniporter protein 4, mitochondrial n=1 Tax=Arachis ipaensis TaxID=130454 RepID=UPI0007AF24CD|nr:calcium uniporter protein 4, mitochondrial [Arachis ipaensis]